MVKITIESLRKVHRAPDGTPLEVIRDLSFELAGGTFTSILGPSGCGKSTLLNLIAGLDDETGGRVLIGGKPIRENRDLNIGFVFQEPRLLNWRTVKRNILLPLERERLERVEMEERARSKIELTGLAGYENYYPLQLSGGMQQRVAIARALVTGARLILADEPTANLDSRTGEAIIDLLEEARRDRGTTFVMATHDPGLVRRAGRVVRVQDGRVLGP